MAKLLVTGGAGFVGVNFVRYWRKYHPADAVIVLDALTYAGNAASLVDVKDVSLVHGDIRDFGLLTKLLLERQIDVVVHFAAESHVDRSIHGPDEFVDTNIIGTHVLLKAAKAVWLDTGSGTPHRFHHVSTDEVFGSLTPQETGFSEITPYRPNSPYSASKAASDHLVRAYHKTFGLQVTTSNCSNNYGPYQFPEKLIPLFTINALLGRPLPIYGDGGNVRDWLHVGDHCCGIERILEAGKPGETYNIGGGEELPNLAVIDHICRCVDDAFITKPELRRRFPNAPAANGKSSAILKKHVSDRKGHDRRYAIDETKIRCELGYTPKHSFGSGLEDTIQWYINNEEWWRSVMDGSYRDWMKLNYVSEFA
ncbi:dTDP-glucose 4,6-dehydratase [Rhizomicrobium electricum]|uniref:dTDP-glucose 4,6-dehydratase n=1 Tax=Rhizomicrobium electricum TaxID=480070 RepID=A0ABN1E9H8_9PROT|nr:dTDP-glucose 4,6-dehydratase [Rhizomicrobium electricum]NIJ47876.1 dTDP-glucose 4,6-dehydratase [Rhizomicrobium electricum]